MEATHYHNTDRVFDLPLLSKNFNAMEMKRARVVGVSTLPTESSLAEETFILESVSRDVEIMTSVNNRFQYIMIRKRRNGLCNGSMIVAYIVSNIIKGNNVNGSQLVTMNVTCVLVKLRLQKF